MFVIKISPNILRVISQSGIKRKLIASIYNSKNIVTSLRSLNSQKIFIRTTEELNGFCNAFSLSRNTIEIKSNQKYLSKVPDVKCWKCKEHMRSKDIFCSSCGALSQPKDNINFFELFGVSQSFDVNLEDLSSKFKDLQKVFHPDKFVNKSKEELEISESYSRLINKAYTILKDPLARGFYILELQKVEVDPNFKIDQNFLLQIMEKNEELDSIDNLPSLEIFMRKNNEEIEKKINALKEAFQSNNLDSAKINLLKLKYFVNIDIKIKEKQGELSPLKIF